MSGTDDGVPIDNEVEEYKGPLDRLHLGGVREVSGAAMTGFAKALGWAVEPEEVAVIRAVGAPPRDDDDPIEVSIDPDHPENTRIVYRLQPKAEDPEMVPEPTAARVWPPPPPE